MNGHLEVVRLLIQEFKWNINQINFDNKTPLCYAVQHQEMARFLLKNGANANLGGAYGPLGLAVRENNTELSRLLLVEYQANPNLNRRSAEYEHHDSHPQSSRNTDIVIMNGNQEILSILLQHGAFIGNRMRANSETSLHWLLSSRKSRETKLVICRILMEHHANNKNDHGTSSFIQSSFEYAIKNTGNSNCRQILLDAGMDPRIAMYCSIRVNNLSMCQLLVRQYHVDPFLEDESDENEDNNNNDNEPPAASPLVAAARLVDTNLLEYFLGIWKDRFASTGGKNSNGDYPIHVVCCDPLVSLQTIIVLVNRHADSLAVVDGEQGLLPFHFAANWGASLDVIFYLLQHCPNALCHGGNAATVAAAAGGAAVAATDVSGMVETRSDDDNNKQQNDGDGPAKKKAKTSHSG